MHDAAEALGGQARIDAAAVVTLEGTGTQYNLGQDLRPGLADQTFTVSAFKREIEVGGPRMRTTQTRTPNFSYFQGPQAQTQVQGLDGELAYNVGANGTTTRASNQVAADRRAEQLHHPLRLLRLALAPDAKLSAIRTEGAERLIDVVTYAGPITLVVGADGKPTRIQSAGSHINLGDVVLSTTFADYADAGGLQLPTRVTARVDDFTTGTYQVKNSVAATGSVDAPAEAKSAAAPAAPAVNIAVEELAPGVWLLAGQSHHSAVVAFKDRLVMIEGPQSEARTLAAIARARELRPGTPLTHLVMSHHHFDHSTGLRAAIAEGLTIVTQAGNEAFVKTMAGRGVHQAARRAGQAAQAGVGGRGRRHAHDHRRRALADALPRGRQPAQRHDADGVSAGGAAAHRGRRLQPRRFLSSVRRQPARPRAAAEAERRPDRAAPRHGAALQRAGRGGRRRPLGAEPLTRIG